MLVLGGCTWCGVSDADTISRVLLFKGGLVEESADLLQLVCNYFNSETFVCFIATPYI